MTSGQLNGQLKKPTFFHARADALHLAHLAGLMNSGYFRLASTHGTKQKTLEDPPS